MKVNTVLNDFLTSRGVTHLTVQPEFASQTEDGEAEVEDEIEKVLKEIPFMADKCKLPCADTSCHTQRCCKTSPTPIQTQTE